jgi:hypothetical protein
MSHDSTTGAFIVLLLRIDVSAELPTPIQPKVRNNTEVISSERNILWTISITLEEEESDNLVVVEKSDVVDSLKNTVISLGRLLLARSTGGD